MKDIGGPVLRQVREIRRTSNPKEKLKLLQQFIKNQGGESSLIELLGNHYIYEWFFMVEDLYYDYLATPTPASWDLLWASFGDFYLMFRNEHLLNRRILFQDFGWFQKLSRSNFVFRSFSEVIRGLNDLLTGIVVAIIFTYAFIGYDKVVGHFSSGSNLIPVDILNQYWGPFVLLSVVITMLWGLIIIVAAGIGVMTAGKLFLLRTPFQKLLSRWFPRYFGGNSEYSFTYNQQRIDRVRRRFEFPTFVHPDEISEA